MLHYQATSAEASRRARPARPLPPQWWVTLGALLGYLHWFFGNLYEAVVFSPNWVLDSPAQMERLHGFFVATSPTLYFVPLTMLATLAIWALPLWRPIPAARAAHRRAAALALASTAINALIVATIIPHLFGDDYRLHASELEAWCWRWNALNVVRMTLVALTSAQLFAALRAWDRASDCKAAQPRVSPRATRAHRARGDRSAPRRARSPRSDVGAASRCPTS